MSYLQDAINLDPSARSIFEQERLLLEVSEFAYAAIEEKFGTLNLGLLRKSMQSPPSMRDLRRAFKEDFNHLSLRQIADLFETVGLRLTLSVEPCGEVCRDEVAKR